MAIINRAALKAQFRSHATPLPQDFFNLIDSTLVKKDDVFFGKWQPGISYRLGDVVIYKNALYCCITQGDDPCGCDENGNEKPPAELKPKGSFCSDSPPDVDKTNWQLLKLEITDGDWTIVESNKPGVEDIMYANIFGRIGMGTDEPSAKVHIHIKETDADFLFSPSGATDPEFRIIKTGEPDLSLSIRIADGKANFESNTDGFLFQPATVQTEGGPEIQQEAIAPEKSPPVIIKSVSNKPAIGIGTTQPVAALSLQDHQGKSLLLNPWNRSIPELLMTYRAKSSMTCFSMATTNDRVQLTTNATGGFAFRRGLNDCEGYTESGIDHDTASLVNIKPDGKVGIGTEQPSAHLEVTNSDSGSFLLSLKRTNPALSVVNLRPAGAASNYITIGADNNLGIFVTDSKDGFVFKRGSEYGKDDNEVNINQGDPLVRISPRGRLGVGEESDPEKFNLDVTGIARMYNLYIDTDERKMTDVKNLSNVLSRVRKLRPVSFQWKSKYKSNPKEGEQYGFQPHEVEDIFPDLVIEEENNRAIAYPNLVALLVRAVQEQQEQIDNLTKRVNESTNRSKE